MSGNIGPLTTTFTPASPDCLTSLIFVQESGQTGIHLGYPGTSRSACLPTSFDPAPLRYYSPGICPSGYSYDGRYSTASNDEAVMVATCCPSGFTYRQDRGSMKLACTSVFRESTDLALASYELISSTLIKTGGTSITSITPGVVTAYAWGPIVRRASTDPTWPIATATASSTSAAASTTTSSTASQTQDSSGLSTGAKAGIGVGVSVGALILIGVCIGAYMLRRRRRQATSAQDDIKSPGELGGTMVQELPSGPDRHMLSADPSRRKAAELPGS